MHQKGEVLALALRKGLESGRAVPPDPQIRDRIQMGIEASITRHPNEIVRVVVYSDEPVLANGLGALIAADPALELKACCSNLGVLQEHLASGTSDVAVLDLTAEITIAMLNELQNVAPECKLILWTNSIAGDFALQALAIGIRGLGERRRRAGSELASNEYFMLVMGLIFLRHAYSRFLSVKPGLEASLPSRGGVKRALTKEDSSTFCEVATSGSAFKKMAANASWVFEAPAANLEIEDTTPAKTVLDIAELRGSGLPGIVGNSAALWQVLRLVRVMAPTSARRTARSQ